MRQSTGSGTDTCVQCNIIIDFVCVSWNVGIETVLLRPSARAVAPRAAIARPAPSPGLVYDPDQYDPDANAGRGSGYVPSAPAPATPRRRISVAQYHVAKFYALRKNGIDKTICKCEGYKKSKGEELTFKDFEEMAGGGVKSQRQVQFLCPKMNHVSMTERFSLKTPKVEKKFKFGYNKGVVHDDGKNTPIYA